MPSPRPPATPHLDIFATLEAEHVHIERALDVLEAMCGRADEGGDVPEADWEGAVRFLRRYADRLHHVKEEEVLFPALERAGMPREGGPVAVMLEEHELGRRLISELASSAGEDPQERVGAARSYVALLRDHIMKENEVLFQMGRSFIPPPEASDLMDAAQRMESMALEPGEREALLAELARLIAAHG